MSGDQFDDLIQETLQRDAHALPKFATTPKPELTARLASSAASKGILATLTGKLVLVGGIGLVAASATYFIATPNTQTPPTPSHATSTEIAATRSSDTPHPVVPRPKSHIVSAKKKPGTFTTEHASPTRTEFGKPPTFIDSNYHNPAN